jgi:hypothetical protein
MGNKAGRHGATAAMEAESRAWLVRCPACGFERSLWELGGIRYKARGTKRQFRRCPNCREFGWHTIYHPRDGVRLAPLRPNRPLWWYAGAFAAVLLLFVGLLGGGLFLILSRASAGPRDAATGYFAAVSARDWVGAQGRLSAAQRGRVNPASLAATWETREGAHGPVASFRVTSFSVKGATARISGTLRYRDGAAEPRTVRLVKEGGAWKIASDP